MNLRAMIVAAIIGASSAAQAHDFWIEPATFGVDVGQHVGVVLCEGDAFEGRAMPRDAARIVEFVARGPAGELPIVGREGRELAGIARLAGPGVYVLGYRSSPSVKEIEAGPFQRYLLEKGLERIVELRLQRGTTDEPAREAYSRYSKSLLRVGDSVSFADAQLLGFRLELVPEFPPYEPPSRTDRSFRLLFEGQPLQGALVTATPRSDPRLVQQARTDADGRVRYTMRHAGEWLLTAVHMVEAAPGSGAQWESFWGSLTFELAPDRRSGSMAARTARSCAT